MHSIIEFFKNLYNSGFLEHMIHTGGIPVVTFIVFAETGLLVGFFLPGDTLLFLAGVAASTMGQGGSTYLNIWALNASLWAAAVVGDQVAYFLGYQTGHAIFTRKDGLFFKKRYADEAHAFYLKNGSWAVVLARFIPVMRTFVPFVAGVAEMPYFKYLAIDTLGGFLWITIMLWAGYLTGAWAEHYLHIILPLIAVVSMTPVAIMIVKQFFAARAVVK